MNKFILLLFCIISAASSLGQKVIAKKKSFIPVQFENTANGQKIVLNDSIYLNAFGEKYRLSKLKYYISNLSFTTAKKVKQNKNVSLINAAGDQSVKVEKPLLPVTGIEFWVGVDSILNCSGAQSGALDPLNDMFWTWNTGYVMFKLEGTADSSKADLQRLEQHIGGYKGEFKTMRKIFIPIDKKYFTDKKRGPDKMVINVNLDKYWNGKNRIRISEQPMITTIGNAAKDAADNFEGMFSVKTTD